MHDDVSDPLFSREIGTVPERDHMELKRFLRDTVRYFLYSDFRSPDEGEVRHREYEHALRRV